MAAFPIPIEGDDSTEFEEIKAPNAPLRKSRSRLNHRNLNSISANLFPSMDEEELKKKSVESVELLGRKRVLVSKNEEASNPINTSLKRVCSGGLNSNSESSCLEALPFDILIKVLCGVDHEDLEQLFQVSKTIKEATEIAKALHFEFTTPRKKTFDAFPNPMDVDDSKEFEEIKAPNAPLRKPRSRLNDRNLSSISTNLFPAMDEEE